MIDRQKLLGWGLIAISVAYLVYFWRTRLISAGASISSKEWFQVITSVIVLMIGTANVRLAAMRERRRNGLPK